MKRYALMNRQLCGSEGVCMKVFECYTRQRGDQATRWIAAHTEKAARRYARKRGWTAKSSPGSRLGFHFIFEEGEARTAQEFKDIGVDAVLADEEGL